MQRLSKALKRLLSWALSAILMFSLVSPALALFQENLVNTPLALATQVPPYSRDPINIDKVFPLLPRNVDLSQKLVFKVTIDPGAYSGNYDGPEGNIPRKTVEEVLEYLEELDNYTRGIPKLCILVGFQEGGHDFQFPQWGPLNTRIKSTEHPEWTGEECLRYLMAEARKYNTACTVHVNFTDVYRNNGDNSPLFDYYEQNGLIARDKNGNYVENWNGPWPIGQGYTINLLGAWEDENGVRKQVDYLFEQLPELLETGVIYTDANGAINASPYDGITQQEQIDVYRQVVSYIRERYNVDVIGEYGFDCFYGYMSHGLTWAQGTDPFNGSYQSPMKIPAYITAAGKASRNTNDAMRIFGNSVQLEAQAYHDNVDQAAAEVARTTIPYLFLNSKLRVSYDERAKYATFSDGVKSMLYSGPSNSVVAYEPDNTGVDDSGYVTIKLAYGTAPNGTLSGQPDEPVNLYLMEEDGKLAFGTYPDPTDQRYHWSRTDGEHFYLQNRSSGKYVTFSPYVNAITKDRAVILVEKKSDACRFFYDVGSMGINGSVRISNNEDFKNSAGDKMSLYMGYQLGTSGDPDTITKLRDDGTPTNQPGTGVYYIANPEINDWTSSTGIAWFLDSVYPSGQYVTFDRLAGATGGETGNFYEADDGSIKLGNNMPDACPADSTEPGAEYFWKLLQTREGMRFENYHTGRYLSVTTDGGSPMLKAVPLNEEKPLAANICWNMGAGYPGSNAYAPMYVTSDFGAERYYIGGAVDGTVTSTGTLDTDDTEMYLSIYGGNELITNKFVIAQGNNIYKIASGNGNSYDEQNHNPVENHYDVFMPLTWRENEVMAYSDDGSSRTWTLPKDWPETENVEVREITAEGLGEPTELPASGRNIRLTIGAGQLLSIVPAGTDVSSNLARPEGGTASYLGADTTTRGDWVGRYGGDGYYVEGGGDTLGGIVSFIGSKAVTFGGASGTATALYTDDTATARASAAQSSQLHQIVDVDTGNLEKRVSLYFMDPDNTASQTLIEAIDPTTYVPLASKYISAYQSGVYVSFNVQGHVQFRLTRIYAEDVAIRGPVYLAGVFLDAPGAGTESMPEPNIYQQIRLLRNGEIEYTVPTLKVRTEPSFHELVGQRAALNIKAVSRNSGILSYQWQRTSDGNDWVNLEGDSAATDTYIFTSLTEADANYSYRCVVTDSRIGWTEGTSESQPFGMKSYRISIVGGTAAKTSAYAGELVAISAGNIAGKYFERWSASAPNVAFTDAENVNTTFVMPAGDVVISAVFGTPPTDGGGSTTINTAYIPQGNIKITNDGVRITVIKDISTVSADNMKKIAGENQTKDVVISGPGYEITFPKGSVAHNEMITDCNFGLIFDSGADYAAIGSLAGGNLVRHLHFNQAGAFPGEAHVTFFVGTQYAGQNLVYSFYNPNSGKLEKHSDALVDKNGYATVIQTHAGDYALTAADTFSLFQDTVGHWAERAIMWVNQRGLFKGVSETSFAPDMAIDRGMFVTVLHRLSKEPTGTAIPAFSDVRADAYYADAVAWAAEQGVADGAGGGAFLPGQVITREQLITMLYRYARNSDSNNGGNGDLGGFIDGAKVSSWAQDAMTWAVGIGLLQGKSGNHIDPVGNATRAETAVILQRFCEMTQQ